MQPLDACPLCRTVLAEGAEKCPGCGTDLRPYLDIQALADRYLKLAHELLSRGALDRVRHVVSQLPLITGIKAEQLAELRVRLALGEGDLAAAARELAACPAGVVAELQAELERRRNDFDRARELYNHGLSAARGGDYRLAARYLEDAAHLDPADPNIWALKLKADLKCRYFQRCYADLRRLDLLAARPPEFYNLEGLLPAMAASAARK